MTLAVQPGSGLDKLALASDQFLTPSQQRLRENYLRLKEEAERRGYSPASVINLHPFSWPVTGPVHQADIKIPAVPLNEEHWIVAHKLKLSNGLEVPFTQHVFPTWKPQQCRYVIGQIDFEEETRNEHIWPIEQAQDAIGQNSRGADRGGAFCYEGIHTPLTNLATELRERELLERAHLVQMAHYTEQFEKFSDAYMSRASTNAWKDLAGKGRTHRWIAMYLFRVGGIPKLPAWYEETSQVGALKQAKCAQCAQSVEPGSVICRHCGRVLNPYVAFAELMIDAETPGAKLAAKRLSDSELDLLMKNGTLEQEQVEKWGLIVTRKSKAAKKAASAAENKAEKAEGATD